MHSIASAMHHDEGANGMSKERNAKKETKKEPTMTPKERKAAKKIKQEAAKSRRD
jgi:hypothetical protein